MPRRTMTVSGDVVVAAPPEHLYALISDPSQMHRWSPENTGANITGPAEVGTTFVGTNRRDHLRWATRSVVTAAEPGARFAWRVTEWGSRTRMIKVRNASWEYRFTPVDGGTRVTETWTDDRRWPDVVAAVVDRVVTGGHTFAEFQEGNIRRTLDRLKADVERAPDTPPAPG